MNKAAVDSLMAQFGTRVFHTLNDAESASHASGLLGRWHECFFGGSQAPTEDLWETLSGRSKFTSSINQSFSEILQPAVFIGGLRCGGPANGGVVDGIVIRNGEPFASNGENYIFVEFKQR